MAMTNAERQRNYRIRKMTDGVSLAEFGQNLTQAERSRRWREGHPEEAKLDLMKSRERRLKNRIDVLTHYGNGRLACVRCGFADIRALSIDHINGREVNDMVARKRGKKVETTSGRYLRLKKEGYPKGYQTLCMNCQWVKRNERQEYMKTEFRTVTS